LERIGFGLKPGWSFDVFAVFLGVAMFYFQYALHFVRALSSDQ